MATFLIIDDKEMFSRNTALFLEKSGHQAHVTASGREGLQLLTEIVPDAIVLDYRLPDIEGAELIRGIRELDGGVPILALCGLATIELAVSAVKAGANDFLTKPVSLTSLRERLVRMATSHKVEAVCLASPAKAPVASPRLAGNGSGRVVYGLLERIKAYDPKGQSLALFSGLGLPG